MFISSITRYSLRTVFDGNNGCNGVPCHARKRWKGHYIRICIDDIGRIFTIVKELEILGECDAMWRGVIILNIAAGWSRNFWRRSGRRSVSLREEPAGDGKGRSLHAKFHGNGAHFLSRYCSPGCLRSARPVSDVKQRDMNVYDAARRKNRNLVVAFCKTSYAAAGNRLKPYVLCAVFFLLVNASRPCGIAPPFPRAVMGNVLSSYRIIRAKCAEHNTQIRANVHSRDREERCEKGDRRCIQFQVACSLEQSALSSAWFLLVHPRERGKRIREGASCLLLVVKF